MPRPKKMTVATLKICPGCGGEFPSGGRGLGKTFCADACRKAFHANCKSEGGVLAPMIKAWHATRHAKAGTREAAICTFARGQITEITRIMLERDDDVGRDAVAYVGDMMDQGVIYIDRRRS